MTPHDPVPLSDDALRWQLRALRQDVPPARDLWPDIAARLATTPQQVTATPARRRQRVAPFALAASVLLAHLDGNMLLLALGLTLFASLAAGFLPAWRAMQVTPAIQLKSQ